MQTASAVTPPRARLKYETLGQLLAREIPTREYLVDPWLRQGESALIYAAPGVGKSMLSMTMALAMAGGGSFLGWTAPAPRRVLALDGEMAMADLQERARDLIPAVAGIDAQAAGDNLMFLARQHQSPELEFPDLATPEGQRLILTKCKRGKVDVLIADNLSTLFTVEDENSASAVKPAVQFLMRMKQAGIAAILIHHTNKGGENYRGSTMLATTFEVIMALTKSADTKDDEGPAFELRFDKYRAKKRDEVTIPRTVHLKKTLEGPFAWTSERAASENLQAFVDAVRSCEFRSQKELAAHFNVNPSTITRWKTDAIHTHKMLTLDAFDAYLEGNGEGIGEGDF